MIEKRAIACIQAVAVGDAMGKMTEGYSPEEVLQNYGEYLHNFHRPIQPKSSFTWGYAEVTDDTTFTLLVAESIIEKRVVAGQDIIQRILRREIKGWPGWDEFSEAVQLGEAKIEDFARLRDRNGAPMRVSPIGIGSVYRRKGLGAALLGKALQRLETEHVKEVELGVDGNNLPALKLYRKFGFKVTKTHFYLIASIDHYPHPTDD